VSGELSALNLADDFAEVMGAPDAVLWELEQPEPLEVWATMTPCSAPQERFQARLLWQVYPEEAPSLKFRDPKSGRLDLSSTWPQLPGFRPGSLDACVNYCAEGLALHSEWKGDPRYRWDPRGNVLLKVLRILQDQLDNAFQGRAA
jgi:hypothetical protein